jgi:hypothetical protein
MQSSTRLRRSPNALTRTVGDVVLVALAPGEGFEKLEGPSSATWLVLDEPLALDHLVDRLSHLYGVPAPRLTDDIAPLVDMLMERRLIESVDGDD